MEDGQQHVVLTYTSFPLTPSIRRGYQVYREVCSACHSLDRIAWRNLVGVAYSVDEVKGFAEEVEYEGEWRRRQAHVLMIHTS